MNTHSNYTIEIIDNAAHLTEALGLRYKIYSQVYPNICNNVSQKIESDGFDRRSIHIGLYAEVPDEKKLAGYCRLILPEYFSDRFAAYFIKDHPLFPTHEQSVKDRMSVSTRLPKPNLYNEVERLCKNFERSENIYIETSRFMLEEGHRGLSVMLFFFQGLFMISNALNIRHTFFTCRPHHTGFYRNYGFEILPGTEPFDSELFGLHHLLYGNVPEITRRLNLIMERGIKKTHDYKSAA